MALKKVKGNFERMFDKNLTDLVRGIRNNKDNEVFIGLFIVMFAEHTPDRYFNTTINNSKFLNRFAGKVHSTMYGRNKSRITPR